MLRIKLIGPTSYGKRRAYSPSALTRAYQAVKEDHLSVNGASKQYGVPLTTLRDRVDNRVSLDCTKNGPEPILSQYEEAQLVTHIKGLADVGYGYTRAEVCVMATDYSVHLGKRLKEEKIFSLRWFYSFLGRWPELKVVKPSSLSEQRARCASEEFISNYFVELDKILTKYHLKDKPHLIYNVDEKGINTEYRPPYVVAGKNVKPQVVMSERSKTVTVIGAGNALGSQIPPYFVFPGQRMLPELLAGKTPGADGTMTASGWSNSDVFKTYLQQHLLKYVQGRNSSDTLLVLYDGHNSHISVELIEWAKSNNIVLFVLPPHCSHILQPMDVGCFGPFQVKYNQECLAFSRANHKCVTRYDVCAIACKAYASALSPSNLQSAFCKSGIYPVKTPAEMITCLGSKIAPSTLYSVATTTDNVDIDNTQQQELPAHETTSFFDAKCGEVSKKVTKKSRRSVHKVIGGKAITEDQTFDNMKQYLKESNQKKPGSKSTQKRKLQIKEKVLKKKQTSKKSCLPPKSLQPGPSHINLLQFEDTEDDEETPENDIPLHEKWCVCKLYYCQAKDGQELCIYTWAQCEICDHWTHLKYCTSVRVVRKDTSFRCPCCEQH